MRDNFSPGSVSREDDGAMSMPTAAVVAVALTLCGVLVAVGLVVVAADWVLDATGIWR